jgi:hypothetical protein
MDNNLENWGLIPDSGRKSIISVLGPPQHHFLLVLEAYLDRQLGKL